jgi:hypothetical protein
MPSAHRNAPAAQTFYLRALRSEGVHLFEPTPKGGGVSGLIGGGQMTVTGYRRWEKVMEKWRAVDDPEMGWAGLAMRDYASRRPLVLMSAVSHARLLAFAERMAADAGRL